MSLAAALLLTTAAAPVADAPRVTFDRYSLRIDGKPTLIWSSEFHPFRLPSPDLWRDILQKMKASGFNTVAIYIDSVPALHFIHCCLCSVKNPFPQILFDL